MATKTQREHKLEPNSVMVLEKAIQTMQVGVTITNPEGVIIYTNASEARMHGYEIDELLGESVRVLAPVEFQKPLSGQSLDELRSWRRETINVRKDGTPFPVEIVSDAIRG